MVIWVHIKVAAEITETSVLKVRRAISKAATQPVPCVTQPI